VTRARELDSSAVAHVLAEELQSCVAGEVDFSPRARALYATDASNYRQVPMGVVLPRSSADVEAAVAVCRRHGAPLLARGAGTSLAGQCCNVAVILDFSRHLNAVLEIHPEERWARVQPGIILDSLQQAVARHGLMFAPDPSTHSRCTLGGMIGNNACGIHSVLGGKTSDNVASLDVLTYGGARLEVGAFSAAALSEYGRRQDGVGEIYRRLATLREHFREPIKDAFPPLPRLVSGYGLHHLMHEDGGGNLAQALVGTEGTCVTVLEATLRLVISPPGRAVLLIRTDDVFQSADLVPFLLQFHPIGLEGLDEYLVAHINAREATREPGFPRDGALLLVEFGGPDVGAAVADAQAVLGRLRKEQPSVQAELLSPERARRAWDLRESGIGATAATASGRPTWPGWEDSAVHPNQLGSYLRELRGLLRQHRLEGAFYGHFGQGCVHLRIDFEWRTPQGRAQFRTFLEEAADLVVGYGGSLSGEHGDGQARGELLPRMFGAEMMAAFREFKAIWDPTHRMNPGKLVDPLPLDQDLRFGSSFRPVELKTHFAFLEDQGSFQAAVNRCVGVGACRREQGGVMCPSFKATREEMHSTRGRARLLSEMLQGDVLDRRWKSVEVHEALDLCLSCKGCKTECPAGVDMATYKAEFLSHYYRGRLRPRSAYALGLVATWAQWGSKIPGIVNTIAGSRWTGHFAKWVAGIAPERRLPRLAAPSFVEWFEGRGQGAAAGSSEVILWPDTFTNYFHPHVGRAAVAVLEDAGFTVRIPPGNGLCCGRPLYDYGMLDRARRQMERVVDLLQPDATPRPPIVGLEPGCVSVFRDELKDLLVGQPRAQALRNRVFLFGEFLERHRYQPTPLGRPALVQSHCHHRSVLNWKSEERLMRQMHLEVRTLEGCCGMAGAFGFESSHYALSCKAAELELLPALRSVPEGELIIANGFSCREQIEQLTGRKALHLAEVMRLRSGRGPT